MSVITISRELGSRGTEIAEDVAAYINAICVDKEVLAEMASQAGVSVDVIVETEERLSSKPAFVSDEMRSLFAARASTRGAMDETDYIHAISDAIQHLADQGNVVLVGRGSQMVLADRQDALHVRIYAPPDVRAARIQARRGLPNPASAQRIIRQADDGRRNWFKRVFDGANIRDPHHYDLMINTSHLETQWVVDLIVKTTNQRSNL